MAKAQSPTALLAGFVDLVRVRIAVMVVVSCAIGYILAYRHDIAPVRLFWTLVATGLLSSGACALNCFLERDLDALMPRTCNRPIPAGVITPRCAFLYGAGLIAAGTGALLFAANVLAAALGLLAVFLYVGVYTPSKRVTWLNTSIGSFPGAIPPLIGWAAASGHIEFGGWVLFGMLFIWQHTHFLPIAWLLKDEYLRAGFCMLPVVENDDSKTFLLTVVTAVVLVPTSLLLYASDFVGLAYCVSSMALGFLLIAAGMDWWHHPSRRAARSVLMLSLVYLPVLFGAVMIDRYVPIIATLR